MKGLNRQEGGLFVDQVSIAEIVKKYGTPAYIYSASKIRENLSNYIDVVGENDKVCYSVKSNSNIHASADSQKWNGIDTTNYVWFGFGTTWNMSLRYRF